MTELTTQCWNTKVNYDVYYFIKFFAAIPDERWCVAQATDAEGRNCALMHTEKAGLGGLVGRLFKEQGSGYRVARINDGLDPRYPQSTPKRRVLAALRDIACAHLVEDEG